MTTTSLPTRAIDELADEQTVAGTDHARIPAGSRLVTVIESRSRRPWVDWRELYQFRDLLRFLVWRHVQVQYAQSVLGIGWAILPPALSMVIFTVVFGQLVKLDSEGAPYALFSFTALVPWTYFSNVLQGATVSLVQHTALLSKVYFPRLLLPLSFALAKLIDFAVAFVLLLILMACWGQWPTYDIMVLPVLVIVLVLSAIGPSLILAALAVQYRDVKHAVPLLAQLLMFAAPVVYPATLIPERYRLVYAVNPLVGVIEGFRAALLGTHAMPWNLIGVGATSAVAMALMGIRYFRSREHLFADVA